MGHNICILTLMLLFKILPPLECSDSEGRSSLIFDAHDKSKPKTDNLIDSTATGDGTAYFENNIKNKSTPSISADGSTTSAEEMESSILLSKIDISTSEDKNSEKPAKNPTTGTDDENNQQISVITLESVRNSMAEVPSRLKRDDDENVQPSSVQFAQEQNYVFDSDQTDAEDSSRNNDNDCTDENVDDSSSKKSSEDSSSPDDPVETDSADVEEREERNARVSEEVFEKSENRNGLYPYWYREQSPEKRYWSSYEREVRRSFIRIPIFPGK